MADGQRVTRTIQITYEAPAEGVDGFETLMFETVHADWPAAMFGVGNVSAMAGPVFASALPLVDPDV